MSKSFLYFLLVIVFVSCKTNKTINGKREGIWITKFYMDEKNKKLLYKSKEVYKAGMPIRTWKVFLDGKLSKKEKHLKDTSAIVTEYHSNGKILKKGKTKIEIGKKEIHWFYDGPWDFFNEKGIKTHTSLYVNGISIQTDSIK